MASASLIELAVQLSRSNLKNRDVQCLFYDRLQQERARISDENGELCGFLDAAAILVRSLSYLDEEGAAQVRDMVSRIVELVSTFSPADTATPQRVHEPPVPDPGVQTLNEMALGDVLVQLGTVSAADVERALAHRLATGMRLGESLIALGLAAQEDVAQGLRLQRALSRAAVQARAKPSSEERSSAVHEILLGEILVRSGKIDRQALERALKLQRERGERLGDVLVELGLITWADVAEGLRIQEERGGSSERGTSETIVQFEN